MNDFLKKLADIGKLKEVSAFLSVPVGIMAYVSSVGVGGILLREKSRPLAITYPWWAFEGLVVSLSFVFLVNYIGSFSKNMNFPAVVGAIMISFGLFVFIPNSEVSKLVTNSLLQFASLVIGITIMKQAFEDVESDNKKQIKASLTINPVKKLNE